MLCQGETGVLPGSEIHFNQTGSQMYRLFYSVNCCGHYYCEYGYRIRRKHMDCLLLLSVEKGQLRLHYQGQRYLAQPGDIVLLDGTHPQYYDTPDYAEFYWLHIAGVNSFDLCEYLTSLHGSVLHRTANNKNAAALVRQVVFQFSTNQAIHNAEQSQMLHQIICGLIADGQPAGGTLAELDDPGRLGALRTRIHRPDADGPRKIFAENHRYADQADRRPGRLPLGIQLHRCLY